MILWHMFQRIPKSCINREFYNIHQMADFSTELAIYIYNRFFIGYG
jgi:hypothetical protein